MNTESKEFLLELLKTPSPSGREQEIQKKWAKYIKDSADKIEVDDTGNVIGIINPDAKFKVLLAGHCDEIGFIIKRIDDKGFLHFTKVGGHSPNLAPGMKVDVFGYKKQLTGVIGVNPAHFDEIKDKVEFDDLYIDCGASSKEEMEQYVRFGDFAVYKREPEFLLNDRISGRGLDNKTGAFIIAEVLKNVAKRNPKVGVYCVSTVSEEVSYQGAYGAGTGIAPNVAIICDVTFATDHPGINTDKHGVVDLEKGPVLGLGSAVNAKMNDMIMKTAEKLQMKLQYELYTTTTGTDGDKIKFTGKGVPITLVSLPLRYMHSPVETASLKDINEEVELLSELIMSLTGEESLKPLEL
ncbi:MAG TPA: M20/M25/M40 family metallo-hydrolase [Patescibacteria group bacterium]|nr:M20/M25/M40 family metallo-hydrolase [Patescibacteria group bacterium]